MQIQSIVGSIGWLAQSTRPDLAPSQSFLLAYNNKPAWSHINAALYVLHYIHFTNIYGFTFMSEAKIAVSPLINLETQHDGRSARIG